MSISEKENGNKKGNKANKVKVINEYIVLGGSGYFGSNFIYWLDWNTNIAINIDWNKPAKHACGVNKYHLQYDLTNSLNVDRIYKRVSAIEDNIFDNPYFKRDEKVKRIIINFAAQSFVDTSISSPEATLENNVNIVLTMLKLVNKFNKEGMIISDVVHISTDEVHILNKKRIEDVSAYALSKKICEDILLKLSNENRIFKIVRPVNLYGIGSRIAADDYGLWQKNKCIITKLVDAVRHPEKNHSFYISNSSRHFVNIQRACNILEQIANDNIKKTRIYLMKYDVEMKIKDLILGFIDRYSLTNITILSSNPRGKYEDDGYGIPEMEQTSQFEMSDFWNMMDWMCDKNSYERNANY
jgi:nucleoside-diphosphate-sugar epimerase